MEDYPTRLDSCTQSGLTMADPHSRFKEAIKEQCGYDAHWLRSVLVNVRFGNQLSWRGTVEVFGFHDHPKTSIAYAWIYRGGGQEKIAAVLGIPPIDSAQTAVKSVLGYD